MTQAHTNVAQQAAKPARDFTKFTRELEQALQTEVLRR